MRDAGPRANASSLQFDSGQRRSTISRPYAAGAPSVVARWPPPSPRRPSRLAEMPPGHAVAARAWTRKAQCHDSSSPSWAAAGEPGSPDFCALEHVRAHEAAPIAARDRVPVSASVTELARDLRYSGNHDRGINVLPPPFWTHPNRRRFSSAMLTCLRVRRPRHHRRARGRVRAGDERGHRRDRRRQVDPGRRAPAGARRRAPPELVRTGAEQAEVEALFDVGDDPEVRARLEAPGSTAEDELVLRRVVQRTGRSRAYVNGSLASAGQLGGARARAVRHLARSTSTTRSSTRARTCSISTRSPSSARPRAQMREAHRGAGAARRARVQPMQRAADNRVEREDLLRFQIARDRRARPEGRARRRELAEERDRLRHAERCSHATGGAEDALYASDDALCGARSRRARARARRPRSTPAPAAAPSSSRRRAPSSKTRRASSAATRAASALDPERAAGARGAPRRARAPARKYGGSRRGRARAPRARRRGARGARISRAAHRSSCAPRASAAPGGGGELARQLSARAARPRRSSARPSAASSPRWRWAARRSRSTWRSLEGGDGRAVRRRRAADRHRHRSRGVPDRAEPRRRPAAAAQDRERRRAVARDAGAQARARRARAGAGLYVFDEVDAGVGGAVAEVIGRKIREVASTIRCSASRTCRRSPCSRTRTSTSASTWRRAARAAIEQLGRGSADEIARMLGGIKITDKPGPRRASFLGGARLEGGAGCGGW